MSETQVVGILVGALQAVVIILINRMWGDVRTVKDDLRQEIARVEREHWAEICRLRDRLHDVEPAKESLDQLLAFMRDRDRGRNER